jgi:hypothetical protein
MSNVESGNPYILQPSTFDIPCSAVRYFVFIWAGAGLQANDIKLRIVLSKQPPKSPFSKGDFYGKLLNLMTLVCNLNPLAVVTESLSCIPTLERRNELV